MYVCLLGRLLLRGAGGGHLCCYDDCVVPRLHVIAFPHRLKDETKKLFSDSECAEETQGEERNGEEEKENSNAGEEDHPVSGSEAMPNSPLYSTPGAKRPNPFKVQSQLPWLTSVAYMVSGPPHKYQALIGWHGSRHSS